MTYVHDALLGHIAGGNTPARGLAIYVEDNATLLCVILPMVQWWILNDAKCFNLYIDD